MKNEMHAARKAVEANHARVIEAVRIAELSNDESAYLAAEKSYKASLAACADAAVNYPTARELSRRSNNRRLENMGLMT